MEKDPIGQASVIGQFWSLLKSAIGAKDRSFFLLDRGPAGCEDRGLNAVPLATKLEAANRQLCAAIKLFFANEDPVAVHTLAGASREIYEKHVKKENGFPTFEWIRQQNPQLEHAKKGERLWDILNRARNFFKNEGKTLTETIDFTDEMNDLMLVMACNDSMNLTIKNSLFEVDAYIAWYLAVHTDIDKAIANTRDQVEKK
jgi:hypothetical protein